MTFVQDESLLVVQEQDTVLFILNSHSKSLFLVQNWFFFVYVEQRFIRKYLNQLRVLKNMLRKTNSVVREEEEQEEEEEEEEQQQQQKEEGGGSEVIRGRRISCRGWKSQRI